MKRVLIITYYWPPSGGAGVQRWAKFVKYLPHFGWEPVVLTVDPEYATYPQLDESLLQDIPPGIRIFRTRAFGVYSLYKKVSSNKEVPYGGFANTTKLNLKERILRFIRGNFFLPDPRRGWNPYALKEARRIIREMGITHVITTSPPHSTQLIGLKLKKDFQLKWIADLRDPWTDIYYYKDLYPTSLATCFNKRWEKQVLQSADLIFTVSDSLKELFGTKTGIDAGKIKIIHNGYDPDDFTNIPGETNTARFIISYVGTISHSYNITGFLKAWQSLPDNIRNSILLRFIGRVPAEVREILQCAIPDHQLEIMGYLPHHEAISHMGASSALLLVIPEAENNRGIVTGKLFEYLAVKKPVLLLGPPDGDAAQIIRRTERGIVCDPADTANISSALEELFDDARREVSHYSGNSKAGSFSRKALAGKVSEVLNGLN